MSSIIEDFNVDHLVKSMEHDDSNARTQSFLVSFLAREYVVFSLFETWDKNKLNFVEKTGFLYSGLVV